MVSHDVLIKKYATVLSKNPDDDKTESRNNFILNFSSICECAHKHDIWSNPKYKETYWRIKIHGLGKGSCIWIASFSRILGSKLFKVTFWVFSYEEKHRKNCECCHHHSVFKGHNVIVHIVVLNCQKCNQCLKSQVTSLKDRFFVL